MKFKPRILAASLAAIMPYHFALAADEVKSTKLEEVVVSASKIDTQPAFGASSLDAANLAPMRSSTSDTASLLRDVPGVSLYGAGGVSSLPVIQGLADDRLRIKVDGMDLISACGNHMNPPLSYIDPSHVGSIQVFGGIAPVSVGGDSIGGAIQVNSPAPEFAAVGQGTLTKGQAGAFYRSNGNVTGGNISATIASEKLSMTYSGSTVESGNYKAGGDFKPAGPAFVADGKSLYTSTKRLSGDEVGSSMYKSTNQSIAFALRNENHLVELKLGVQDIPYQGFPNQRMDMTANDSEHVNLRYTGQYDWGTLQARAYNEHTRHKMNFLEDKAFWYKSGTQTIPAPGMPMDTEGRNTGAVVKADIVLSARDLLRVGGEYQRYRFNDWWDASGNGGMSPNTFLDIKDGQRDRYAAFAEWEARWNPQWLSQLGVRSETVKMDTGTVQGYNATYNTDANAFNARDRSRTDNNWDMTALARYTVDSSKTYEFGYARKTRSPNLYERYTWSTGGMAMNMINMVGDGNGYVGNLDLKPEVANTLSATADWHDTDQQNWGLKVTPYYTYVQDYINAQRLPTSLTSTGFVFLKYVNQDARLYGLDVSGYFPLAKNTGFGNITATGVLNYVRGKTSSGTSDDLYNMMPLNAKLAVAQHLGSWINTAEVQLVDAKTDVSQIRNELKTAGYSLLNLRSSYAWKKARFDVGIENVFDRLYDYPLGGAYVGQGTTMPPTGGAPYGIAVPGMGRSIYAGVTVKF
ncbi:TonB-dependent receptor [Sulfuricella denitrificans skB26]|uniref:TonB-dependent receptor n=1 Tax=Sulfuricella denitrificans (strain DSM 22764 / NBRC 105220 / skB26) TaxID=1163617 RepID=S6AJ72_SULDS|nr:TonB-dependent receptor [Sulfuricella denitrificans]BAN36341.1 TonB-dependent receptor [Sulfuricella denitrificans skB26]